MDKVKRGLIIVHTGDGKGKTTAALGIALRAVGHKMKVKMIQFIKGKWRSGELEAAELLTPYLEITPMGRGFTWDEKDIGEDRKAAAEAWELSKKVIFSGDYDIVILDEINYAIAYKLLDVENVLEVLKRKPENLHLILTGRKAHPAIMDIADLITEMKTIKHPFEEGVKAQRGIEF